MFLQMFPTSSALGFIYDAGLVDLASIRPYFSSISLSESTATVNFTGNKETAGRR
jgi:hypothetical protein